MTIPEFPTFIVQPATSPASQVALRILVEGAGIDPEPIGTAVWICSHLVLTARHNIVDIARRFGTGRLDETKLSITEYSIRLYQILPGPEYVIWEARDIWCSAESDLALINVSLWGYSGERLPDSSFGLVMKGLPPPLSSKVAGFGYHSITTSVQRHSDGRYHLDLNDVPQATTGYVTDVFPDGRDSAMYPFPCFQVNARFDHAMSGGPVFNETGQLVGIICGSLDSMDDGEEVSYVATIWPVLRILIRAKRAGHPTPKQSYPAIDLALDGLLAIADLSDLNSSWFPGRELTKLGQR